MPPCQSIKKINYNVRSALCVQYSIVPNPHYEFLLLIFSFLFSIHKFTQFVCPKPNLNHSPAAVDVISRK